MKMKINQRNLVSLVNILKNNRILNQQFSTTTNFYHRNRWAKEENTKNDEYKPEKEMNYEIYDLNSSEAFTPSRPVEFVGDRAVIFEYSEPKPDETGFIKLPQVPYEIKEHAMKGFFYTFILTWAARFFFSLKFNPYTYSVFPFIPAGIFAYQYLKSIWYMINAVTKIELLKDGKTLVLGFKHRNSIEVQVNQLIKKREENFLNETFTEPFLFPVQLNFSEQVGKESLKSHRTVYLYGDCHEVIKNGEVLRAILNNQTINIH